MTPGGERIDPGTVAKVRKIDPSNAVARLARQHIPKLRRLRDRRHDATAQIDHAELAIWGEVADALWATEDEYRSHDPTKSEALRNYTKALDSAGLEYSRETVRKRIVAVYVFRKLADTARCLLTLTQLFILDRVPDEHLHAVAEAAGRDRISTRQLEHMVSLLAAETGEATREDEDAPERIRWTTPRVSRRVTTVVEVFEREFRGASAKVRKKALQALVERLAEELKLKVVA